MLFKKSDFHKFVDEFTTSLTNLNGDETDYSVTIVHRDKFAYRYPVCEIQIPINESRFHKNYRSFVSTTSAPVPFGTTIFTVMYMEAGYFVFPMRQSEDNYLLENDLILLLIDHIYNMGYKDDEDIYHFIDPITKDRIRIYLEGANPMIERSNPLNKDRYFVQRIDSYFCNNLKKHIVQFIY